MKTSQKGIDLIRQFEGCRLTAYKPVAAERYYTIGYGHYGPDVTKGMRITKERAEELLRDDLVKYERYVIQTGLTLNQNQFDALVSFTFNCGQGNLKTLIRNRSLIQIADALLLYNKGSGKVLPGLDRRRRAERELFLESSDNPYREPVTNLKEGSSGNSVRWIQYELNKSGAGLTIDGIFGNKTDIAVRDFQRAHGLVVDGIVGAKTRAEFKKV